MIFMLNQPLQVRAGATGRMPSPLPGCQGTGRWAGDRVTDTNGSKWPPTSYEPRGQELRQAGIDSAGAGNAVLANEGNYQIARNSKDNASSICNRKFDS